MEGMYYVTCLAALSGTVVAMLVGLFGAARLVMTAARDWLIPPFLATIYPRTQTPLIATLAAGCTTGRWALPSSGQPQACMLCMRATIQEGCLVPFVSSACVPSRRAVP